MELSTLAVDTSDTQDADYDSHRGLELHTTPVKKPWARLVGIGESNPDIELLEDVTVVGRADANGNEKVSKFHCRIYKDSSGKTVLRNLSKNGTLVNDELIKKEECKNLSHGDEIVLGPLVFGLPKYMFHNKSDGKRSIECLDMVQHSENAKQLKVSKIVDDFKCSICLSLWHDVVSVAPCFHNFCNGCFSEWYKKMKGSRCPCPQCREPVVYVKRNPTLSNILEDYVQEFPSLRRPSEEIAHLDRLGIVGNNFVKIGVSSNSADSETSTDDDDFVQGLCPQCRPLDTSDNAFQCGPQTNHLVCYNCDQAMPERPELNVPQKCTGCSRALCGLYWASQNVLRGLTCMLKKLSDRHTMEIPTCSFRGNAYEEEVTRCYLQEHRIQILDVVNEWFDRMNRGEIEKPEIFRNNTFTSDSHFCNNCADTIVGHLIYKFRLSLPKNELPPDAASRNDCWYGRLCRTQFHRRAHALKYNHACEPRSSATRNL